MKIYLQTLIVLLLAVPFVYMLYDVIRDIALRTVRLINHKAGPLITSLLSTYGK